MHNLNKSKAVWFTYTGHNGFKFQSAQQSYHFGKRNKSLTCQQELQLATSLGGACIGNTTITGTNVKLIAGNIEL